MKIIETPVAKAATLKRPFVLRIGEEANPINNSIITTPINPSSSHIWMGALCGCVVGTVKYLYSKERSSGIGRWRLMPIPYPSRGSSSTATAERCQISSRSNVEGGILLATG